MLCNSDNLQPPQSGVSVSFLTLFETLNKEKQLGKPSHIIQPGLPEIAQFNP